MAKVLIISDAKAWPALKTLFAAGSQAPLCAASAGEARRQACLSPPALAVVNTPLPDEFGRELALQFAGDGIDVILLAAAAQAEKLAAGMELQGVFVLPKPLTRQNAAFALRLIRTARARTDKLAEQNRRLTKKLDEMRMLSRAKCALVRYCGMTEPEAHHVLEQRAMDARVPLKDAALEILKIYEPT